MKTVALFIFLAAGSFFLYSSTLSAQQNDTITFTINDTTGFSNFATPDGGWHSLRFKNELSTDTSILSFCKFEYGKAIMLDPKYYLAVSLPLLTMGEFMKIASAPGEIEKDIKRTYK